MKVKSCVRDNRGENLDNKEIKCEKNCCSDVCRIELVRKQANASFVKEGMRAYRFFPSTDEAENWLISKGFVFGQCQDFQKTDTPYWFHQKDSARDYIEVKISLVDIFSIQEGEDWINKLSWRNGKNLAGSDKDNFSKIINSKTKKV